MSRRVLAFAAILTGLLFVGLLLLAAEAVVRLTTTQHFSGNSASLFTPNRFGSSHGHTPNTTAYAFQEPVYLDADGFRVPSLDYRYPDNPTQRLLILGDSVAFGLGVDEGNTFVGLLRAARPRAEIHNAAVIGHGLEDYRNVARVLLATHRYDAALLVLCLNDVSHHSAQLLTAAAVPQSFFFVERLRAFKVSTLTWLREHSKLYLTLHGLMTDPSARYFLFDYLHYDETVNLSPLADLVQLFRDAEIPLTVVLTPYEYQLRPVHPLVEDIMKPQRVLSQYLAKQGVTAYDATPLLEGKGEVFLRFDPMHFNGRGHRLMVEYLNGLLTD